MKLTIFDLDNTLLGGDSDHTWGKFLVEKGMVDKDSHQSRNDQFYEDYNNRTLDIIEYQSFVLGPVVGMSKPQRDELHHEFLTNYINPLKLEKADQLITEHKTQGDTLLVITATNEFIATPIVHSLGIDHILATTPEEIDGVFTGNIIGHPCYQEGKIKRLQQWLVEQEHTFSHLTFYSDSMNDAPLLEFVDTAIAVDPDELLHELADKRGWPVISLRD